MTAPADLPTDKLSVVLFGPGFGESVVVHIPPDDWLVVDSLLEPGTATNPAVEFLRRLKAEPTCLVLSHPHEDHAAGFDSLVAAQRRGPVGCVPLHLDSGDDVLAHQDAERAVRLGRARHAVAAVRGRWQADASSQWQMRSGEEITLGSARLTVLSPRREVVARASRGKSVDLNALSAALTITWKAVRVVLGADLPATEWGKVVREDEAARPGEHIGLKIPHHGSAAAQHAVLAHPNDGRTRTWAVTPWNRGATLPRFEDEEGIALLLTRVREVHLTSLPVELRPPLGSRQVTRTEVARRIARRRFGGDDIVVEYDAPTPSAATSWVLASFDEDGTLTDIRLGPNAVTIM